MYVSHLKSWVNGKAAWDIIFFIVMTILGYSTPFFFFFAGVLVYTVWRLQKGADKTTGRET